MVPPPLNVSCRQPAAAARRLRRRQSPGPALRAVRRFCIFQLLFRAPRATVQGAWERKQQNITRSHLFGWPEGPVGRAAELGSLSRYASVQPADRRRCRERL